jgi:hypothetical protein
VRCNGEHLLVNDVSQTKVFDNLKLAAEWILARPQAPIEDY